MHQRGKKFYFQGVGLLTKKQMENSARRNQILARCAPNRTQFQQTTPSVTQGEYVVRERVKRDGTVERTTTFERTRRPRTRGRRNTTSAPAAQVANDGAGNPIEEDVLPVTPPTTAQTAEPVPGPSGTTPTTPTVPVATPPAVISADEAPQNSDLSDDDQAEHGDHDGEEDDDPTFSWYSDSMPVRVIQATA